MTRLIMVALAIISIVASAWLWFFDIQNWALAVALIGVLCGVYGSVTDDR